jgi:hypothetical protein
MTGEHHEPDGIPEAIEDLLRSGLLLGTRLAERHARAREQALRDAARHSLEQAREERTRQEAQRQQALSRLEGVFSSTWWEHASAEDIRAAWTAARSYQHEDPRAARGVWRIADELKDRYGLDAFQVDPAALGTRAELEQRTPITDHELVRYDRELARLHAQLEAEQRAARDGSAAEQLRQRQAEIDEIRELIAEERARTADEPRGETEMPEQRRGREARELGDVALIAGTEPHDISGYDTRERRAVLAERLAALDLDAEAVHAAVLADAANAQPPEMAAGTPPRTAPRARAASQARRGRRQARRLG